MAKKRDKWFLIGLLAGVGALAYFGKKKSQPEAAAAANSASTPAATGNYFSVG